MPNKATVFSTQYAYILGFFLPTNLHDCFAFRRIIRQPWKLALQIPIKIRTGVSRSVGLYDLTGQSLSQTQPHARL
jgi:hypothetical protein